MVIRLDENYNAMTSTALLGYVGETNARPVSVEGLTVDGADRYVLTIDYGDGVQYEVDITGGQWTPTADILRSAQTLSCQICAKKLSGDEYVLVKKSRIFRLRIGAAIGDNAVPSPDVSMDALDKIDAIGKQAHADMQTAVTAAETATTMANNATKSATNAEKSADTATQAAERAETAKTAAETFATQAETAMQGAENARQQAVTAQNAAKISAAQASASAQQTTADKAATAGYAQTAKINADSTAADRQAVQTLATQVTADKATVADHAAKVAEDRIATENALSDFDQKLEDADEILTGVEDIKAYLGYVDEDIVGLCVDYKNKTFKRLAGAYDLTGGSDFDKYLMFGGRKRCNVADDGSIVAFYGDDNYSEDGSMGQVMVYQPAFYYKVVPLEMDVQTDGIGYHLRKANYYVSTKAKTGFKRHPLFYDKNGEEIEFALLSAFEGSIFDVSADTFLLADEQVMDNANDKFCSIAGAKLASGKIQDLTRPKVEQMSQNRGSDWHGDLIKAESANQLLMIIEMGMMNLQTAIGQGVISVSDTPNTENNSKATGQTSSLGNSTGQAEGTAGQVSITYRGVENPWGNIWKFVYGVNIWGNGSMKGGVPYICTDFNFAESKNSGNYESAGFTVTNAGGYISAMGYGGEEYDWLFFASECLGNSSVPVGDYHWITQNLNGYRIALLGGGWHSGSSAGGFCWALLNGVGGRDRTIGGRLVYVPTKATATSYATNITAWNQKMKG